MMSAARLNAPVALVTMTLTMLIACQTSYPRRDPTGESFPSVQGQSLRGQHFELPAALIGAPALLLVGFEQETQFDLDRWLLAATQSKLDVAILELPTIPGFIPGLISNKIDAGMRRGIPIEDQSVVVTLYDDAEILARFTGNEDPLPGRILLLDREGQVVFFHDRGYSVSTLMRLREALEALPQ